VQGASESINTSQSIMVVARHVKHAVSERTEPGTAVARVKDAKSDATAEIRGRMG